MTDTAFAEACNGAVVAWISTFPTESRLEAYLATLDEALRKPVRKAVEALRRDAERFIEAWPEAIGMEGLEAFYPVHHAHLKAMHPWLNDAAWARIRSFSGWYIWHEGV